MDAGNYNDVVIALDIDPAMSEAFPGDSLDCIALHGIARFFAGGDAQPADHSVVSRIGKNEMPAVNFATMRLDVQKNGTLANSINSG
jgi:hypothetical protein